MSKRVGYAIVNGSLMGGDVEYPANVNVYSVDATDHSQFPGKRPARPTW